MKWEQNKRKRKVLRRVLLVGLWMRLEGMTNIFLSPINSENVSVSKKERKEGRQREFAHNFLVIYYAIETQTDHPSSIYIYMWCKCTYTPSD